MKTNRDPRPVLQPGRYSAIIHKADETKSKAGNDMMKLSLKVDHADETYWVNVYVMANRPKTIDAILESCGYPAGGDLDPEKLEGCEVVIVTSIEEQEGFDPQAKVERWVPKADALAKAVSAPAKQAAAAANTNRRQKVADADVPF